MKRQRTNRKGSTDGQVKWAVIRPFLLAVNRKNPHHHHLQVQRLGASMEKDGSPSVIVQSNDRNEEDWVGFNCPTNSCESVSGAISSQFLLFTSACPPIPLRMVEVWTVFALNIMNSFSSHSKLLSYCRGEKVNCMKCYTYVLWSL